MFRVYLVPGTHQVKIRVEVEGRACDCAVLSDRGVACVFSPPDAGIRRELLDNGRAILHDVNRLVPGIRNLKMSEES